MLKAGLLDERNCFFSAINIESRTFPTKCHPILGFYDKLREEFQSAPKPLMQIYHHFGDFVLKPGTWISLLSLALGPRKGLINRLMTDFETRLGASKLKVEGFERWKPVRIALCTENSFVDAQLRVCQPRHGCTSRQDLTPCFLGPPFLVCAHSMIRSIA